MRGLIAAIIAIAVIGAVVLLGGSNGSVTTGTGNVPSKPTPDPKVPSSEKDPVALTPVKVVLECEEPTTLDGKTDKGQEIMKVGEVIEGQPVRYLEVASGFITTCGLDDVKIHGKPGELPGRASYEFEAPRKDIYYLHLRAKWRDECCNSVYVGIDDDKWHNLEDTIGMISQYNYRWAWHPLLAQGEGKPKAFMLEKGKHTLWLNTREDGVKLDQFLVSTEADAPVGSEPLKK